MIEKFHSMTSLPGLMNAKDIDSKFVGFSQALAELVGWKSAEDSIGKSDYDVPCGISEFADEFIKLDKKVIESGSKMLALDVQNYSYGWKLVLAEKNPIKNQEGAVIAIFSSCMDVSNISLFRNYFRLYQSDVKFLGGNLKPASYILSDSHSPLNLTEKQENCLFFLVRGKTIKEIAKCLEVSPRTIECHLDAIKSKLGCQYKSEIIEKAIDAGFFFYIPKKFQENGQKI